MSTTPTDRSAPPRMGDYDDDRASFRLDVPERFNPVLDIIERWAQEAPDDLALLSLDGAGDTIARQSVADLALESRRAAQALLALGVRKGDPVFVMLPRIPAWYSVLLGAIRIGAVPMPAPNLLTSRDIAYRLERGEAVVAVTDAAGAGKVDAIGALPPAMAHQICWTDGAAAPEGWHSLEGIMDEAGDGETPSDPTSRDDAMLLYFTSGTVSYPKMVLHPTSYGLGHVGTARFWHDLRPGDLHWTVTDTGWAKAAWGGLFGQWHERASVVQVNLGKPDADAILGLLSRHRITSFCAPPTLYRLLVQTDLKAHDLSALRHCTSAGEPLNAEVLRVWAQGVDGLTVFDGYGQTETTCLVANYRAVPVRP
ncbi:MAG: acetyl-CoA synthetase, partial [Solirubrobacterales bacterium]|nr:acetyl-CoA synthetase [Solirubrobacterales bacterium]